MHGNTALRNFVLEMYKKVICFLNSIEFIKKIDTLES